MDGQGWLAQLGFINFPGSAVIRMVGGISGLIGPIAVAMCGIPLLGEPAWKTAQPLTLKYVKGTLALAHNGNLPHADELRTRFEYQGLSSRPPATPSSSPTPSPRPVYPVHRWRMRYARYWID